MVHALLPLLLAAALPAGASADASAEAERLLKEGKNTEAASVLNEAIKEGATGARLYSMGTAHAYAGEYARAHGALLRACRELPFDSDCRNNLDFVRRKLGAAAETEPTNGFPWARGSMPAPIAWIAALGMAAVLLILHLRNLRPGIAWWGVAGLLTLMAAALQIEDSAPRGVVVTDGSIPLRTGPAASFPEILALPAGSWVAVEESRDGWTKISFQLAKEKKNRAGWIPSSGLVTTSGRP